MVFTRTSRFRFAGGGYEHVIEELLRRGQYISASNHVRIRLTLDSRVPHVEGSCFNQWASRTGEAAE